MKKICGIIASVIIIAILCSGIFVEISKFFAWLFALKYSQPETSIVGGVIVRVLTFIVSYSLVGTIFVWRNRKLMKVGYFLISTVFGFVFAWIVWKIEQYILVIGIVLGIIAVFTIAFLIIWYLVDKKNKHFQNADEESEPKE